MRIFPVELQANSSRFRRHLPSLAPYALAVLVLLLAAAAGEQHVSRLPITSVRVLNPDGSTSGIEPRAFRAPAQTATLEITVNARAQSTEPLGLYLSGLFSAVATWNGVVIGTKGRPAATSDQEVYGPIDTVLPIPAQLVRPGGNTLRLELSSHGPKFGARMPFHAVNGELGFSVAPFSADRRRAIGHYLAPLLTAGFLCLALAMLATRGMPGRSRKEQMLAQLFLGALLVAACAEISRAFIAYAYPYHGIRLLLITSASAVVGAAMALLGMEFAGIRPSRLRLGLAAAVLALIPFALEGFDERAAFMIAAGATIGCGFALRGAYESKPHCAELAAAFSCITAFAIVGPSAFLDGTLYAASIPLVTSLVSFRAEILAPAVLNAAPPLQRLAIGGVGHKRYVAPDAIKAVHGAGNYAEFELTDGERVLDDRSLSDLAILLPQKFFRTHRSHIVNLEQLASIVVLGPGKYAVEMTDKSRIPLSRSRVADLRANISPESGSQT